MAAELGNVRDKQITSTAIQIAPLSYRSEHKPTWCPGCGDYGVLNALYKAMAELQVRPESFVVVSGIGCSSRLPEFVNAYGFHSVHGRLLPIATGIKLARPDLEVLAVGGDGDGLAIGGNHFMHAARRNVDIAYLMMDNSVYGMTKGQPSPTTEMGHISKASPYGVAEQPINPATLAIAFGATFVARGFSGKPRELEATIVQAIRHRGFAFVHILSPCVTFLNTYDYWAANTVQIEEHDLRNKSEAFRLASLEDVVRLGVLFQVEEETLEEKHATLSKVAGDGQRYTVEDFIAEYR